MQGAIDELKALGRMPDSTDCEPPGEIVGRFEKLLAKVKLPLTAEEVGVLMRTFPESTMYEVEWGLLRLSLIHICVLMPEQRRFCFRCHLPQIL